MKQYVFNDFIEEFLGKTVLIKKKMSRLTNV